MKYGYTRVSTETQVKNGYGLDTQMQRLKEYGVVQIYSDAGISGTIPDRPGLGDLLSALSEGDKVVVLNTSRLWRNDTVKVLVQHELKKLKADIISLEQPGYSIYNRDPNDFLINSILEILDQYDRMLISRKLAAGRRTRAKSGKKACGRATDGYMWVHKEIVMNPERVPAVIAVFEFKRDTQNYQRTAELLNENKIPAPNGGLWSRQQVYNTVNNDFYIGIVTYAGVKYPGTQPVFISQELWDATR